MWSDELVAFMDESLKPVRSHVSVACEGQSRRSFYAAAAAIVLAGDVTGLRLRLAEIAAESAHGLHYSSLSQRQRWRMLAAVANFPEWDALVVETNRPVTVRNDRSLRSAVLGSAMRELTREWGVCHLVIESRAHPDGGFATLDRHDVLLLARLRELGHVPRDLRVEHASKAEIVLGLADLLAGARTDWLCGVDRTPWSMVAHRIRVLAVSPKWKDS